MPSPYPYNYNIPNPPNDPADDVGPMQQNTQSINDLIAVDHVGFSNSQGGFHTVVHLTQQLADPVLPGGSVSGLYAKQIAPIVSDEALFFKSGGNRIYQLTCNAVPVNNTNGFSFFAGGILINWGVITLPTLTGSFTQNFSAAPYVITLQPFWAPGLSVGQQYTTVVRSSTTSGFVFNASSLNGANPSAIYFTAIGPS